MGLLSVFKHDIRHQFSTPILSLTFIAVACLPILYSGFLIMGNWDPYNRLEDLPVAIVNLDQGATYEGTALTVGDDFVEELKKDQTINWQFVSEEEANSGLAENTYYAAITVPADFSERAASLSSDNPRQAELIFEANGYSNFIAAQISENATRELRSKLSASMTEAYTRSIIEQFSALSGGLQEAGDGAGSLAAGATELETGIDTLQTNLSKLSSGVSDLNSGVGRLQTGAVSLEDGAAQVSAGGSNLANGIEKLGAASSAIEDGAGRLAQNSGTLASGIKASSSGMASLSSNLSTLSAGAVQLKDGLASSADASSGLAKGNAQLSAGLQKLMQSDQTLQDNTSLQSLLAASQKLTDSAEQLQAAQQRLAASSRQLSDGQAQALAGAQQLASGQVQLEQGAAALQSGQEELYRSIQQLSAALPELVSGGTSLAQGATQVGQGATKLKTGIDTLADGANSLSSGATKLTSGATALGEGANKLSAGSAELAGKLTEAADKTAALHGDERTIAMMAQPVAIRENQLRKVTNYGSGIAPYFLSLGFFAGSLVYSAVFPIRESSAPNASGFRLFLSKLLSFGIMSLAQALMVSTIVIYVLGLSVQSIPLFYVYTAIVSFAFLFLVQMLVTWLEKPGQFVALLLLILQLVGSAGTFPYELLPGWAKAIHPWLPMSYSVTGYRDIISSGAYGEMWTEASRLLLILIVSIGLIWLFHALHSRRSQEGQASLSSS